MQGCNSRNNVHFVIFLAFTVLAHAFYRWRPIYRDDPYARPFCDASGKCGEKPDIPSPRTVFSAKSKEQFDLWWQAHSTLNRSAEEYATRRRETPDTLPPLILLGDSITESWIGTNMGKRIDRANGVPPVLTDFFQRDYDPLVLAIGGDQTQHLLYRLQNGELLPAYANDERATYVILIGTNNLGAGELPGPTSDGVMVVAEYILQSTKGRLLLLQLLPRGDRERVAHLCPPRCDSRGSPFVSFIPAVKKVNDALRDKASKMSDRHGANRLSVVNCGTNFTGDATEVDESLMPDRLHPNAEGHRILAKCIQDCIEGSC